MITFTCSECARTYSVPDASAGRKAKCRCGEVLVVPGGATAPAATSEAPAAKLPLRTRRLLAEAEQIKRAFARSELIRIHPGPGSPPETYEVEYNVRGLEPAKGGEPTVRQTHRVAIQLTSDYPRLSPKCKMLTPVFHPNIDPSTVCVGDHWVAGERLADLIVRIGEILAYQAYNIKSPLDAEAAMWADLNGDRLPIDDRNLRPPDME